MYERTEPDFDTVKFVGQQIRKYRLLAGMTQVVLAETCGIYRPYLSRVESGTANPTLSVLEVLAAALKVDMRELICGYGPKQS